MNAQMKNHLVIDQNPQLERCGMKRAIVGISTDGLEPGVIAHQVPVFTYVKPNDLLVDERYQRGISDKSVKLIQKIITGWDWCRFKPPVVALTDEGYEVIDGQHTAIAAASHPEITTIPAIVVEASSVAQRANAFVGHNRDRLNISSLQMHHSAVAAEDPAALELQAVCDAAGVRILRTLPSNGHWEAGDTIATTILSNVLRKRGAVPTAVVLNILVKAGLAPVSADAIKAVECLLHDPEFRDRVAPDDLTETIVTMGAKATNEAKLFAATHNVSTWRGLAAVLWRNTKKQRVTGLSAMNMAPPSPAQPLAAQALSRPLPSEIRAEMTPVQAAITNDRIDMAEFLATKGYKISRQNGHYWMDGDRISFGEVLNLFNKKRWAAGMPGLKAEQVI